tara:strand:- start:15 stop:734 length:720 start_codon:yes stop_codon:yes gene_type:complete
MSFWNKRVQEITTEYDRGELNLSQGTIQKTIGYTHPQYTAKLYQKHQDDKGLDLIKDPDFGNPQRLKEYSQSTLRCLDYARYLESFGMRIGEVDSITDFGSGYGNFCRIWKLWNQQIRFYNCDLPEMLEIQKHYIENTVDNNEGVEYITHKELNKVKKKNKSLFIAAYSLSECSLDVRTEVEPYLPMYDYILIVHNTEFDGIDNVNYFTDLQKRRLNSYECKYEIDEDSAKWWLVCKRI